MELATDVCTHVHTYGIPRAGLVERDARRHGNIGGESVDGWKRGEISCSLTSARQ